MKIRAKFGDLKCELLNRKSKTVGTKIDILKVKVLG